jgi:hypothetical protein
VEEKGWLQKAWDATKSFLSNTVYSEAVMTKTAQGAAEMSQSLFSQSNAYVPYGAGQKPLEVEGPQQSHLDYMRDASNHGRDQDDKGLSR